jgi:hypothetical protein
MTSLIQLFNDLRHENPDVSRITVEVTFPRDPLDIYKMWPARLMRNEGISAGVFSGSLHYDYVPPPTLSGNISGEITTTEVFFGRGAGSAWTYEISLNIALIDPGAKVQVTMEIKSTAGEAITAPTLTFTAESVTTLTTGCQFSSPNGTLVTMNYTVVKK